MKIKFKKSYGGREKYFSVKYKKDLVGDCTIRAIAHGTGLDYMKVYTDLFELAMKNGCMPNSERNFEEYLFSLGWKKNSPMKNGHGKILRMRNYKSTGTYIIRCSRHLTCIKDGVLYDTGDWRAWCAQSYYTKA